MSLSYGYIDIRLNDTGDEGILDDIGFYDGDFNLCANEDSFRQHMKMRILTNKTEIPLHPNIGADIEELEGMPNTRDTGIYGTEKIKGSISVDNDVDTSEVIVRAVPTAKDEITFYTYAEIENAMIAKKVFVNTTFNLSNAGLLIAAKPKPETDDAKNYAN